MRSDQVTWGFIQLGLEILQGWRLHDLSGQPVPVLACPHGSKVRIVLWLLNTLFEMRLEPILIAAAAVGSVIVVFLLCWYRS